MTHLTGNGSELLKGVEQSSGNCSSCFISTLFSVLSSFSFVFSELLKSLLFESFSVCIDASTGLSIGGTSLSFFVKMAILPLVKCASSFGFFATTSALSWCLLGSHMLLEDGLRLCLEMFNGAFSSIRLSSCFLAGGGGGL
jgi:hypothetical protein